MATGLEVEDAATAPGPTLPRILIADDQTDVLEALRLLLKSNGYSIATASSPTAILEALEAGKFDVVLMDLNYARDTTSGREGIDLLGRVRSMADAPPIVVMTGWATVGLAVEAMQQGVRDFVEKPWTNARLLEILRTQVERGRAERAQRQRTMLEEIERRNRDQKLQRQAEDIEEARRIQQRLLPEEIPQFAGLEICGAWQPARAVGGDYFDVLKLSDLEFAVCIADVSGKGMPAALLMSNFQGTVRGLVSQAPDPEVLCRRANEFVCRAVKEDRFITFFYATLDAQSRGFHYTNAGHNPPIVVHRDGTCDRLSEGGSVLGVFPQQKFATGQGSLLPGDRMVLFTDGMTEAANGDGEEFGEQRLLEVLLANRYHSARKLKEELVGCVSDFCRQEFADDATLLVIAVE